MIENQIKKLKLIKEQLREGAYNILQKTQWNEFSRDLSSIGGVLLKDIEQKRDETRNLKVSLFFFLGRRQLNRLNLEYSEIVKNFDLFFDTSMRWLESIIDGNRYEEYQIITKQYVEKLTEHCSQTSAYLAALISVKTNDYYHYQALFFSLIAIFIAIISVIIRSGIFS